LNLNHFVTQNRDQILLAVEDIPKTLSQHLSACVNTLACSLQPTTMHELYQCLGCVNFYQRIIA
ncbi:hypothetical protein T4B_13073, partial [Trichinella pseudospiralis]